MPRKPKSGVDDFATLYPELAKQWHPTLNNPLSPEDFLPGSKVEPFWVDEFGHVWKTRIQSRVKGQGCPFCAGVKILAGFNDVATTHPHVVEEWHSAKNSIKPTEISAGSHVKVWWKCNKGHEWQASVYSRASRSLGCQVCADYTVIAGVNDLETRYPELASEWHPTRNSLDLLKTINPTGKRKVWWLGKCGHEWVAQVDKRTSGEGCLKCLHKVSGERSLPVTSQRLLVNQWHPTKNGVLAPEDLCLDSSVQVWWRCENGHEWIKAVSYREYDKTCPVCVSNKQTFAAEKTITEHLQKLNVKFFTNVKPVEDSSVFVDFYLPEQNFAINLNSLVSNNENNGKGRWFHYNNWLTCKSAGIQLLQIWEDDWIRNPERVLQMIAVKSGVYSGVKVFARKTSVVSLSMSEAESFLEKNHIQGFASGSYYLGLKRNEDNQLVAVIVLRKEPGTEGKTLNIIRYATSCSVVGGFTKLLTYAERAYSPETIITFSDHCVSNGGLYENNGFVADKELEPDYMYVFNNERKHKFGYRLKRFRNDPELQYVEGYTEKQLAELNNLPRIWDAGKTRWVKKI